MRTTVALLMLAAAAAAQTAAPTRGELETIYNKVRAALQTKDYAAFVAMVEPARGQPLPKKDFDAHAGSFLEEHPDLATTRFIKVAVKGDWAGYYMLSGLDDEQFLNIEFFRFRKVGNGWKLLGATASAQFPKGATPAANERIVAREIENNEILQMPGDKP
jgi:hypothetical protein